MVVDLVDDDSMPAASSETSKFPLGDLPKLGGVRTSLATAAARMHDRPGGDKWAWFPGQNQQPLKTPPLHCGSGQLIAHFSYLSYSCEPRTPEDFGLRLRKQGEGCGTGVLSLHAACESGAASIKLAKGKSYGKGALSLVIKNNNSNNRLEVVVPAGTIFEHISWIHHQNLLVGRTAVFRLEPGQEQEQKIGAYCMNESCACSDNDQMHLTSLLCEKTEILQSQGKVWDHFEGLFEKYRTEAGFGKDKKKGAKGKKKAK